MEHKIDFTRYKYYFNGWIARKDKLTNKTELFYKGKWTAWNFNTDLDLQAHFGDTDVVELSDSDKDKKLLLEQIQLKINTGKSI